MPRIRREQPIQIAPDFSTVGDCKDATTALRLGQIWSGAWLVERMLQNVRLRAVLDTRLNGHTGTEIRFAPGKNNASGRRAARDIVEDWPLIASTAARKQLHFWGILLGLAIAQKHWYASPESGRLIPRLEVFHPHWVIWDSMLRSYRITTMDGLATVPSPSLMVPGQSWDSFYRGYGDPGATLPDDPRRWVIHEPFGTYSFRWGLVHSLWFAWLGHENVQRDESRAAEKLGIGVLKLRHPQVPGMEDAGKPPQPGSIRHALVTLQSYVRRLGKEAVVPLQRHTNEDGQADDFDLEPLEWSGVGYEIISRVKDSKAIDLAVAVLGHNLTSEARGGSYAAANVGDRIRDDIRAFDASTERDTIYLQVLGDWAEANYGDRSVAPIPIYDTSPAAATTQAAQGLFALAQAVEKLRPIAPGIDWDSLLERWSVPLLDGGAKVLQLQPSPAGAPGGGPAPTTGGVRGEILALQNVAQIADSLARRDRAAAERAVVHYFEALVAEAA